MPDAILFGLAASSCSSNSIKSALLLNKPTTTSAKQRNAILDELDDYLNGCIYMFIKK